MKLSGPNLQNEQKLWKQGYRFVVGLDEVGRGPLAGPVVAAAVCLAQNYRQRGILFSAAPPPASGLSRKPPPISKIRDSKKLNAAQREKWYKILTEHPDVNWGVGIVSHKIIDKINIFQATKLAMRLAIKNLTSQPPFKRRTRGVKFKPDFLLLDGSFFLDGILVSQKAVPKGDEKIVSCAAASIIAKITRDRMMIRFHNKYPQYGFDEHKGYGCQKHYRAIKKHGPCPIHRLSFGPLKKSLSDRGGKRIIK